MYGICVAREAIELMRYAVAFDMVAVYGWQDALQSVLWAVWLLWRILPYFGCSVCVVPECVVRMCQSNT
jgi:hypothetical protein